MTKITTHNQKQRLSLGWFAREVLKQPLYDYQELVGNAILDSVFQRRGLCFTVMFARQMGKNQLSAIIEAYLLACMEAGSIVKAAPTFKPQIITSRLRLLSMLENPLTVERIWRSYGYMIGVAPTPELRAYQAGPRLMFFSAGPEANIVGATASLLLEIDEAQDVSIDKYNRDLRPMASTNNATTVLYGTAWSDDTLLATTKASNQELELRDGLRRNFHYDWTTLAALNPHYKKFVEAEMERLGEEHITIRTQYRLLPISGAGLLLNEVQRALLRGTHNWQCSPIPGDVLYIAGIDIGGEDRAKPGEEHPTSKRDSTVITIGHITYNDLNLPTIQVVHQVWWTGKPYLEQYAAIVALCEQWNLQKVVIDRTGLGDVMTSLLIGKLGDERIIPFQFSRPSKSRLTYQLLSMISSGRLKLYRPSDAITAISDECWQQLRLARYRVLGEGILDMYVPPGEGHDDFLISIALCCEAIREWSMPAADAFVVRPRKLYGGECKF